MLKQSVLAAALIIAAVPATAATHQASAAPGQSAPDAEISRFLKLLQSGKGAEAIDNVMRSSPLFQQKAGLRETLIGQVEAALGAYGPITAIEKLSEARLGTMVTRQRYLVQHRDMVVRWEFHLIRAGTGWEIGNLGFNDEITSWIDDDDD